MNKYINLNKIGRSGREQIIGDLNAVKYCQHIIETVDNGKYILSCHYFNSQGHEVAYYINDLDRLTILSMPRQWTHEQRNNSIYKWSKQP